MGAGSSLVKPGKRRGCGCIMWWKAAVASGAYRSRHILSSRYPDSWGVATPFIALNLFFAFAQYDSIACVWTPVTGSTKFTLWLTVA